MFFSSIVKAFHNHYNFSDNSDYSSVDNNIIRYFKTEYGSDWQAALENHLYKEGIKNDKKAA